MDAMTLLPDDLDAPEAPPRTMELELNPPIEFAKKTFSVLHLREPKGKHVRRAEQELGTPPVTPLALRKYQMQLIAQTAGVPFEVIDEMNVSDIEDAFRFLSGLLDRGPATGAI